MHYLSPPTDHEGWGQVGRKWSYYYRKATIIMTANISSETMQMRRQLNYIFKVLKEKLST